MRVPKRRPPRPHSCSWSRSPLRQCAAAKPSQVMKPNSTTKMMSATQFTPCMTCLSRQCSCWFVVRRRRPLARLLGDHVDHRIEDRGDDHPQHLVPVEERYPEPDRLHLVVERWPQERHELHDEEQVPPAPGAADLRRSVHG